MVNVDDQGWVVDLGRRLLFVEVARAHELGMFTPRICQSTVTGFSNGITRRET